MIITNNENYFNQALSEFLPETVETLNGYIKNNDEVLVYLPFLGYISIQNAQWAYHCPLVKKNVNDFTVVDTHGNLFLMWHYYTEDQVEFRIHRELDLDTDKDIIGKVKYNLNDGTFNIIERF